MDEKAFNDLKEQVENLNKGIATYRDDAQAAKAEAAEARKEANEMKTALDDFKKLSEKKDEPGVKLSAEEEARFKAYVDKNGLMTKAELEAAQAEALAGNAKAVENQAISEFLEKHPEYDDKEKWDAVLKEFSQYKVPTTLAGFRNVLDKIYGELSGEGKQKDAEAAAKAKIINRAKLGLAGGGSQRSGDEGDAESKLEAYSKKYPNLSKDQIIERLSEIDSLYPAK